MFQGSSAIVLRKRFCNGYEIAISKQTKELRKDFANAFAI